MEDILNQKDIDLLYHFTKADTAKVILESGNIRLSQLRKVNDPKEALSWPYKLFCSEPKNAPSKGFANAIQQLEDYTLDHILVACFKFDKNIRDTSNDLHPYDSKGITDTRMWSHYADSHKGVCLLFDRPMLEMELSKTKNEASFVGPINYYNNWDVHDDSIGPKSDPQEGYPWFFPLCRDHFMVNVELLNSLGIQEYMLKHIKYYYKDLIFQKNLCWESESEYRIALLSSSTREYYDLVFNNSLKGVILGNQCCSEDKQEIITICKNKGISVYHYFSRGWQNHFIRQDLYETSNALDISISYPVDFPYYSVYMRIISTTGEDHIISVDETGALTLRE